MFNRVSSSTTTELGALLANGKEAELGKMLKEEFRVPLRLLQDKTKIEAMATPTVFMDNRAKDIERMFAADGVVTTTFKSQLAAYKALELPDREAMELASAATSNIYETALKGYDLKYTDGYEAAFGTSNAKNIGVLANAQIADGSLTKGKEHYKKKYATKYERKMQKQLAK